MIVTFKLSVPRRENTTSRQIDDPARNFVVIASLFCMLKFFLILMLAGIAVLIALAGVIVLL
jgi:hypothetical protein